MTAFRYRAATPAGKVQAGMIEAATPAAARQSLRAQGLMPIEMAEVAGRPDTRQTARRVATPLSDAASTAAPAIRPRLRKAHRSLPLRTLTLITLQLSTLLGARVRVDEALSTVARAQPPQVAGVLLTLHAAVVEGRSLAEALDQMPGTFSEVYRATVRAGEQAGQLGRVMAHLAGLLESRARNRQTVQLALLYPALLAVISLAIITLLLAFVLPDIVRVFSARSADLPFPTRALIWLSGAVRGYGLIVAGAVLLAGLAFGRWVAKPANRLAVDRAVANGRLTRRLSRQMNAAQIAGTLATLLKSGVPLIDALNATTDVTPNHHIRATMVALTDKVRQGRSLRTAMDEAGVFPPMMLAMVASGETTGNIDAALDHVAQDQQRSLDAWVKAVVALVEPVILLVMGGLVMGMVLAILLPIISMNALAGS